MSFTPQTAEVRPILPHVDTAYKDAIYNLMFHKQKQLHVAYYCLLLQVALYGLIRYSSNENFSAFLLTLSIANSILAVVTLWWMQCLMTTLRNRLSYIYQECFDDDLRQGLRLSMERRTVFYDSFFLFLQSFACGLSFLAVWFA